MNCVTMRHVQWLSASSLTDPARYQIDLMSGVLCAEKSSPLCVHLVSLAEFALL